MRPHQPRNLLVRQRNRTRALPQELAGSAGAGVEAAGGGAVGSLREHAASEAMLTKTTTANFSDLMALRRARPAG